METGKKRGKKDDAKRNEKEVTWFDFNAFCSIDY